MKYFEYPIGSLKIYTKRLRYKKLLATVLLGAALLFISACADDAAEQPASEPSAALIELGRELFFDTNLSEPAGQACAGCHDPAAGFADPDQNVATSEGVNPGLFGSRNTPTAAYAFLSPAFAYVADPSDPMAFFYVGGQFLDGRRLDLVAQAQDPFLNPIEMANPSKRSVVLKVYNSTYSQLFTSVFGMDVYANVDTAYSNIAKAIAVFEASAEMNPFSSKFDFFQQGRVMLSAAESRGLELFRTRGRCSTCHTLADPLPNPAATASLFTNFRYFNIGVPKNMNNPFYDQSLSVNPDGANFIDLGLGGALGQAAENGKFKVPTLRNVELTAPYMHNGVFTSLEEVVDFYNTADTFPLAPEVENDISPEVGFLDPVLTAQDQSDLVAFMKTLTDGYVLPGNP